MPFLVTETGTSNNSCQNNMISHSELVAALMKPGRDILGQMTPQKANLMHIAHQFADEAGEIVSAIKKHTCYNQELDVNNLVEEIGDLQFAIEALCQAINRSPGFCMAVNIEKLTKRYGGFYSDQAAKDRADKKENA